MTDRPLTEKLGLKGQLRALILNAPKGYRTLLGPLPPDITVNTKPSGRYDFVHLFVANSAELATFGPAALAAVKPMAIFWISYPKQGGGVESDISRDHGWEIVSSAGYRDRVTGGGQRHLVCAAVPALRGRRKAKPGIPLERLKPGALTGVKLPEDLRRGAAHSARSRRHLRPGRRAGRPRRAMRARWAMHCMRCTMRARCHGTGWSTPPVPSACAPCPGSSWSSVSGWRRRA